MENYPRDFGASERWIYLPAASAIAAVVVLGFAPSYFLRPFGAQTDSLSLLVHVHGALLTAWVTLFLVQTTLVASGRTDLHRRLGMLGMVFIPLIFGVSIPMILIAAKLGGHHMPGPPLPALALVLASLLEFVILAALGLRYRFRSDIHKRLMLLASVTAMEAAAIRLPIALFSHDFGRVHVATDLLLLVILGFDAFKHRRAHPAFVWGMTFLVAMQGFSLWLADTQGWLTVARAMVVKIERGSFSSERASACSRLQMAAHPVD